MKNINYPSLSQLYEKPLPNGRLAIYTRINNFKCGEIDFVDSTFYSVKRSYKNIMKMFNALGLNEEILTGYKFQFIIIPFNKSFLQTYREKWLKEGIKSPFCNDNVDRQILLPLDKINMEWKKEPEPELSLFSEVV